MSAMALTVSPVNPRVALVVAGLFPPPDVVPAGVSAFAIIFTPVFVLVDFVLG
jgi:hypothetical protein